MFLQLFSRELSGTKINVIDSPQSMRFLELAYPEKQSRWSVIYNGPYYRIGTCKKRIAGCDNCCSHKRRNDTFVFTCVGIIFVCVSCFDKYYHDNSFNTIHESLNYLYKSCQPLNEEQ